MTLIARYRAMFSSSVLAQLDIRAPAHQPARRRSHRSKRASSIRIMSACFSTQETHQDTSCIEDGRPVVLDLDDASGESLKRVLGRVSRAHSLNRDKRVTLKHLGPRKWELVARNVIGTLSCGSRTILIGPKIPLEHVLHLAIAGGTMPSFSPDLSSVGPSKHLTELIMWWFVDEVRHLLASPLFCDYVEADLVGETWAGALDMAYVAKQFYQRGKLEPKVLADQLSPDTPVNRVLLAALNRIVKLSSVRYQSLVRQAKDLLPRFAGVGEMLPRDRTVEPARRMASYSTAWTFACHILDGLSRTLGTGDMLSFCFLLPTAQFVEKGLRSIIQDCLKPGLTVSKPAIRRHDEADMATVTFNPDLAFRKRGRSGFLAVGDVKYKVKTGSLWNPRTNLEQAVTFAAAANVNHAVICKFAPSAPDRAAVLDLNKVKVTVVIWPTDLTPAEAEVRFAKQVEAFLARVDEGEHLFGAGDGMI